VGGMASAISWIRRKIPQSIWRWRWAPIAITAVKHLFEFVSGGWLTVLTLAAGLGGYAVLVLTEYWPAAVLLGLASWVAALWAKYLYAVRTSGAGNVASARPSPASMGVEASESGLKCSDIEIWDDGGEQYVRVQIRHPSLGLTGLTAYLEKITDSVGALAEGEVILNEQGRRRRLSYPIQLFTSERLKVRLAGGEQYAWPFDMRPNQPKLLEIFQVEQSVVRSILVYDVDKRHSLITPEDARFDCVVYDPARAPLTFSVRYDSLDGAGHFGRRGFAVTLLGEDDEVIARKEHVYREGAGCNSAAWPDFQKWDAVDVFKLQEAAWLWIDQEPQPLPMSNDALNIFNQFQAAIYAGELSTRSSLDEAINFSLAKFDDLKDDEDPITVDTRIGRAELRRFALATNVRPKFIFKDQRATKA
jgi:hypothetical protein